jgi:hypothetical protein
MSRRFGARKGGRPIACGGQAISSWCGPPCHWKSRLPPVGTGWFSRGTQTWSAIRWATPCWDSSRPVMPRIGLVFTRTRYRGHTFGSRRSPASPCTPGTSGRLPFALDSRSSCAGYSFHPRNHPRGAPMPSATRPLGSVKRRLSSGLSRSAEADFLPPQLL